MTGYGDVPKPPTPVEVEKTVTIEGGVKTETVTTPFPAPKLIIEYLKDVIAIFAGTLMVIATQLDKGGFSAIQWAAVVSSALGGIIAWSRTGSGGFRKE